MALLDAVRRKWKDLTGQTKAEETDKLVGEWSLVMREYADELSKLGDLYASVSGRVNELVPQVEDLTRRVTALAAAQKRAAVALWLAGLALGSSLGLWIYIVGRHP